MDGPEEAPPPHPQELSGPAENQTQQAVAIPTEGAAAVLEMPLERVIHPVIPVSDPLQVLEVAGPSTANPEKVTRTRRPRKQISFLQMTVTQGSLPPEIQAGTATESFLKNYAEFAGPSNVSPASTIVKEEVEDNASSDVGPVELHAAGALASPSASLVDVLPTRNKGVGKNRPKASETARTKTKSYTGAVTRRREKMLRDEEENIRKGMKKLLSTSRQLLDDSLSPNDDSANEQRVGKPIADFSSHDLIRSRVAEPESFDETDTSASQNTNNDILVLSSNTNRSENPERSWSFSLNPFSYLTRPDVKFEPTAQQHPDRGRIESIDGDLQTEPQHSSTPN